MNDFIKGMEIGCELLFKIFIKNPIKIVFGAVVALLLSEASTIISACWILQGCTEEEFNDKCNKLAERIDSICKQLY